MTTGLTLLLGIAALIDSSLLRQTSIVDDEPRYTMLETVREFGLDRLAADGEGAATRDRHAAWCMAFAERAWRALWQQPLRLAWVDRVEREHDNLRAALAWYQSRGNGQRCLELAVALAPFWYFRSHRPEGMAWLERGQALAGDRPLPTILRARIMQSVGMLAEIQPAALAADEESLRLWRELDDDWGIAASLQALTIEAIASGGYERARTLAAEALAGFESFGNWERVADLRYHLGRIAYGSGDLDRAAALLEASLTLAREVADPLSTGQALTALGLVCVDRGDLTGAAAHYREGLTASVELGRKEAVAHCLAGLAVWAGAGRRPAEAARLFGVVAGLREVLGYDLEQPERARYELAEAAARAELGDATFASAFAAGRALRLETAIVEAAALVAAPPDDAPATPRRSASFGLTGRELDVLRLLATGRSDREIAAELFISHRTAMTHVSNILGKLGVDSRTGAAARALREGLL